MLKYAGSIWGALKSKSLDATLQHLSKLKSGQGLSLIKWKNTKGKILKIC